MTQRKNSKATDLSPTIPILTLNMNTKHTANMVGTVRMDGRVRPSDTLHDPYMTCAHETG